MNKAAELTTWIAEHVAERSATFNSIRTDLEYALGQLNRSLNMLTFDGCMRAKDALERAKERLCELT
jgi:hypothetical protein